MNDGQFRIDRDGADKIDMQPGDCFIIETPGGGQPTVPKVAE
jgi:5-oxoprolinase (ATP-hydrolysing)